MLVFLSVALADALPMPTLSCPRGATAELDHGNEYCAPARCGEGCDGDCEQVGLCVERREHACGGQDEDCTYQAMVVLGECAVDADCEAGLCRVEDRCVPTGGVMKSCGCATGLGPAGVGMVLLLLGLRRR